MNRKLIIMILPVILLLAAGSYFIFFNNGSSAGNKEVKQETQLWTCGMHPDIIMNEPGNCPICGMKLTPMKNDHSSGTGKTTSEGTVSIDPVVVQNMNVKTVKVEKRQMNNSVVTNGVLVTDETKDHIVTTRVNGWVNKLYINYTGQKVMKGDKLMDIYSPELVAAQQELLTAMTYKKATGNTELKDILTSGDELIVNTVKKLQLLEMSEADIQKLQASGEVKTYITLYAQKNGTVVQKDVIEGQKVNPGMPLLHISNLTNLWLTADIYENELSKISVGATAEIRFNFMPGKIYREKISFVYPTLDVKTRTGKIRIDIPNSNGQLKPAMLANVVISGNDLGVFPVIPENAVIRAGRKDVVVIALGEGKFKPQEVQLGDYSAGFYQVVAGLNEGDEIVTSAQFMIDSESNLKAAVSQYSSGHYHENINNQDNSSGKIENEHEGHKHEAEVKAKTEVKSNDANESIVRKGLIDLKAIDKNNDGKVFQDQMCWNVVSDKSGRCPICEMILQEVSIDQAKKNLIDNDFKVK